jgi:hypothetical protein
MIPISMAQASQSPTAGPSAAHAGERTRANLDLLQARISA